MQPATNAAASDSDCTVFRAGSRRRRHETVLLRTPWKQHDCLLRSTDTCGQSFGCGGYAELDVWLVLPALLAAVAVCPVPDGVKGGLAVRFKKQQLGLVVNDGIDSRSQLRRRQADSHARRVVLVIQRQLVRDVVAIGNCAVAVRVLQRSICVTSQKCCRGYGSFSLMILYRDPGVQQQAHMGVRPQLISTRTGRGRALSDEPLQQSAAAGRRAPHNEQDRPLIRTGWLDRHVVEAQALGEAHEEMA